MLSLLLVAMISCTGEAIHEEEVIKETSVVSKEEALERLNTFLSETQTKSVVKRTIQSVGEYYRTQDGNTTVPAAYIVNFNDCKGFAVLGARSGMDGIIAITDSGQMDAETLTISFEGNDSSGSDADTERISAFVKQIIKIGVSNDRDGEGGNGSGISDWDEDPEFDPSVPGVGGGTSYYTTRSPMLSFSWSQEAPYNSYCEYFNPNSGNLEIAATGCSTTAMAMIVAANEFPQSMYVNGIALDWEALKGTYNASYLLPMYQNQVALLMGSIFHHVYKTIISGQTCIFPQEIKERMEDFGYSNVIKLSDSTLSSEMKWAISDMLRDNKPVFISAIPGATLAKAHSWVVDGGKYSSGAYLLHFNFGWNGKCNGYFSPSCLNPSQGIEYDNGYIYNEDDDYTYNWHFRVITYDIPSSPSTLQVEF